MSFVAHPYRLWLRASTPRTSGRQRKRPRSEDERNSNKNTKNKCVKKGKQKKERNKSAYGDCALCGYTMEIAVATADDDD